MVFLAYLLLSFSDIFGDVYESEFMEFGIGARALGMGNAFVGLADDPTAFYWNPAGLAQLKNRELFLMHSEEFEGEVKLNTAALTYPYPLYTLGVAIYWVRVPNIPFTDTTEYGEIEYTSWVDVSDYVIYISYAKSFTSIQVGVNAKGIFRDFVVENAYGLQTDFGVLSKFRGITIGLNLVNVLIGSPLYWSNKVRDYIPMLVKSGVSIGEEFPIGKINLCLGFDASIRERVAQFTNLHTDAYIGSEYWWKEKFAIRMGWDKKLLSTGCGIVYRTLKLNYALKFHPDLGLVKRLSGHISF